MRIRTKRVYEAPAKSDGARFLVDRLWPRGMKKEALQMAAWLKEVAPSDALRKRFHDQPNWPEFRRQYARELDDHPLAWQPLIQAARKGNVTLLYSARDVEYNNALALQGYLERKLGRK
jgi:uncharacterized protein YeaO (DUF488 family)